MLAPAIVLAAVVASVATERVAFRWVRNASPFTMLLTSFALERLSHALWAVFVSPTKKSFAGPAWAFNTVEIGGIRFEVMDLVTIAVTAVVLAAHGVRVPPHAVRHRPCGRRARTSTPPG